MKPSTNAFKWCVALLAVACSAVPPALLAVRSTAQASTRASARSFHPRFRRLGGPNELTRSDGPYTLIWQESYRDGGTIIDEATGHTTPFTPPAGCDIAQVINPLGGPWALAGCGLRDEQSYELYDMQARTYRQLMPDLSSLRTRADCLPDDATCVVSPVAIGARWIEFDVGCEGPHCPASTFEAQNIWSGEVRTLPGRWLRGGATVIDPNSGALGRKLCRPVSLPSSESLLPGAAAIEGAYVISTGMGNTGLPPVEHGRIYIQRCGSKRRMPIDPQNLPLASNAHAVLWNTSPTSSQMTGLIMPSLRPFTVHAPAPKTVPILSDRTLYFANESGDVWGSVGPFPPAG